MTTRAPLATDALPSRWPTVAAAVVVLTTITSVLLIASAAGTAVAQTLQTMATGLAQDGNASTPVAVRDLAAARNAPWSPSATPC